MKLFGSTLLAFATLFLGATLLATSRSATHPNELADFDHTGLDPIPLTGTVLYSSDGLGLPGDLMILSDKLLILDRMGNPALHVVDRRSGHRVTSLGREGEGPGEFEAPVTLDPVEDGSGVWVHDVRLQRLTYLALTPTSTPPRTRTVTLRADGPVIDGAWVSTDRFLTHGFFFGGRIAVFDGSGALLRYAGPLPENPWGAPPRVLQHAYQGTLEVRPDRDRVALATRHAGWIEVFDSEGQLVRRFSGPFRFEPRFSVDQRGERPVMASGKNLQFGYIDLAVTQERLYALFSGRTRAGFPGRANYAEYVHVFDWEGKLERVLHLDGDAFTIAVDEKEHALYATRHLPAPAVLAYPLERSGTMAGRPRSARSRR